MGLDMYLSAHKYVSGYKFSSQEEQISYNEIVQALGLTREEVDAQQTPSLTVKVNVAYWRKANAIHRWFIEHSAANGEDTCQEHWVSREALEELRILCQRVLEEPSKANEHLPSQGGFFFGSTEYDEGYFDDLKQTIKHLDRVLNNPKFESYEFYYTPSW